MRFQSFHCLAQKDKEEVVSVVVYFYVKDHRLFFDSSRHGKCGDFALDELADVRIVSVFIFSLVVIGIRLALGMGGSVGFHNLLVEFHSRRSTLACRGRFQLVDICRGMCLIVGQP